MQVAKLRAETKTEYILLGGLLFAHGAAFFLHSLTGLKSLMDGFVASFLWTKATKQTIVMHWLAPLSGIVVNGTRPEKIDSVCYLGSFKSSDCSLEKQIQSRIWKASNKFSRLNSRRCRIPHLTLRSKGNLFRDCIPSTHICSSENCQCQAYMQQERNLSNFQIRGLRSICSICRICPNVEGKDQECDHFAAYRL